MKAAILRGVNQLAVEEVPEPKPLQDDEVLVEIDVCGVCGTDVHMWAGTNFEGTFPFIPGHEWCGRVVEAGSKVHTLKVGDRVTGEQFIPCHTCKICRAGGPPAFCPNQRYYGFTESTAGAFAEYHRSPEERIFKVPDSVSNELAALTEPIAVAYHAVWGRAGGAAPHDRIGIFGAGPIGLFAMGTCLVSGADVIVMEPAPYRQQMARDMGAKTIVDPTQGNPVEQIMDLTNGLGLTKIIECSGNSDAIGMTVDVIAVNGVIALTGQSMGTKVPIEIGKSIWTHASIVGSCGCPFQVDPALDFMAKGLFDFEKIITNRYTLDQIVEAFELGNQGTGSGKIMVYPDPAKMPSAV